MNDKSDTPPGAPSQEPQDEALAEQAPMPPEELVEVLKQHRKWLETDGEEGEQANLQNANLRETDLRGRNLRGADLRGAKLFKANLWGADLGFAKLQGADLAQAVFGRTAENNPPTDLSHANLWDAKLADAQISDVTGLQPDALAGANLSNAKLADDIKAFEGLKQVAETSQNARKIFFGLLLGCVYSWLTIATTTDARLLANSSSSPLPIIQTEIPIAWFYWAAPLVLLAVYFYFHLYLLRLWEALAKLPAVFPDGKRLDERAYPWLLNGLVRGHVLRLKEGRPALSRLQNFVSIVLAWGFVPFTLAAFWLRYIPRQDWWGTSLLMAYLVTATGFGLLSYLLARRALRKKDTGFPWKAPWRDGRSWVTAATVATAGLVSAFSYGAIMAEPFKVPPRGPLTWLPSACVELGCYPYPFADLRLKAVSLRPPDWWKADKETKASLEGIAGANLRGRSLRHARAVGAFLAKADFSGANLQGAFLGGASLQGADLWGAYLQGGNLYQANLQGARLFGAKLQGANLNLANLQGADLWGANLQGANLTGADLRGARLRVNACQQLSQANFWQTAYRDKAMACGAPIPKPPPDKSATR